MDPVIDPNGASETAVLDVPVPAEASVPEQNNPEIPAPDPQGGQPTAPDDVSVYQDIVAKYNADPKYEMTDAESDSFLAVQDRINNKEIEEPPLKEIKPETPEDPKKGKEDPDLKPNPDDPKDPAEANSDSKLNDSAFDSMYDSMKKVGAKDVTELPSKIQGLIDRMSTSGGQLGSENAALKGTVADLQGKADAHMAWLSDLKAGKKEAVDFLVNKIGYKPNGDSPSPSSDPGSNGDSVNLDNPDEFVDEKLYAVVKDLKSTIDKQNDTIKDLSQKNETRDNNVLKDQAVTAWVDDVVKLVTEPANAEMYGLTGPEARGLAEQYWKPVDKKAPIHPKFQKVHELISFAHKHRMPNLETAHVVMQHNSGAFAQKIIEAEKKGEKTNQHLASVNSDFSKNQSRRNPNIPQSNVTDETLDQIERGNYELIPDEWMDDKGNYIATKVPQRFHARVFGSGR